MEKNKCDKKKKRRKKSPAGEIAESAVLETVFGEKNTSFPFPDDQKSSFHPDPSFGKKDAELFVSGRMTSSVAAEKKKSTPIADCIHAGHRQRLRARYLQAGSDGMTDYDLLELLLTYAIARRDVKIPARTLLEKFKTLGRIFDAEHTQLSSISGIGENSALLFRIMRDLCVRYLREKMIGENVMDSPEAVENYARMKLGGYTREVMLIIYLNVQSCVIDSQIVSKGTVDCAVVYPREIVAEALAKKASGVILVHNHPSGNVTASDEDIEFTKKVKRSLNAVDILLLDHLIVSRTAASSVFGNKYNKI